MRMSFFIFRLWLIGVTIVAVAGCVEEIDFSQDEVQGALVVDGYISQGVGPHTLKLFRSANLSTTVFPAINNATVYLVDQDGNRTLYSAIGEGTYMIPEGVQTVLPGEEYHLEIKYASSNYTTDPERVPDPLRPDSSWYQIDGSYIDIWVANNKPDVEQLFIKWEIINYWALSEYICSPLKSPKTCYFRRPVYPQNIPLFEASRIPTGTDFNVIVGEKFIDYLFGNPQSWLIVQETLTPEAFEYFSKVNLITTQSGSLFDPQPATAVGNVHNVDDPDDIALGYFAATARDSTLFFSYRGDFVRQFQVNPYCGIPGFPIPSPECCNCLRLQDAECEKPPYWP